jgi:hypothetical protein
MIAMNWTCQDRKQHNIMAVTTQQYNVQQALYILYINTNFFQAIKTYSAINDYKHIIFKNVVPLGTIFTQIIVRTEVSQY